MIPVFAASAAAWVWKQVSSVSPATTHTLATCDATSNPFRAVVGVCASSEQPYVAPFASAMHSRSAVRSSTVLSDSPGIWISIVVPDKAMSGSPTPKASTRLRMFSRAVFIVSASVPSGADRITDTPPCRSNPSTGRSRLAANAAIDIAMIRPIAMTETHSPRLRFTRAPAR